MKRQDKIARLLHVGCDVKLLSNMSNAQLGVVYELNRPRLERMAARAHAANLERQRLDRERMIMQRKLDAKREQVRQAELDAKRQADWMRRCVKVPFPKIEARYPNPVLDFGLAEFLSDAKYLHAKFGDQDAAATLRVLMAGRWGAH